MSTERLPATEPVSLSTLPEGSLARFHEARLDPESRQLLLSLGMTASCLLRVCQTGDPCIVEVRSARIGLSRPVSHAIFVVPEPTAGDR